MKIVKTNTRNINNKRVYEEIDNFMIEVFSSIPVQLSNATHREQLVEMVDMWFEQYALESGKIIQFDVKCSAPVDDEVIFALNYRQRNCFNTTTIEYVFEL